MKLSLLLQNVNTLSGYTDVEINTITCNLHGILPGCLFVCMPGDGVNICAISKAAVAAGAAAVMAEGETGTPNQVLVGDSMEAYSLICAAYFGYPAQKLKLVAITGIHEKTITACLLSDVFENAGMRTGLISNVINVTGEPEKNTAPAMPDSYELHRLFAGMAESGCAYCVLEVSSRALEQKMFAGVRFEAVIFMSSSRDMQTDPGDNERSKAGNYILFEHAAMAVINLDDSEAEDIINGIPCPCVTYSVKTDASDYTAKNINFKDSGVEYELVGKGVIGRVRMQMPGSITVYDSMGAAVCATELGIPFRQVLDALAGSTGAPGRLEAEQ